MIHTHHDTSVEISLVAGSVNPVLYTVGEIRLDKPTPITVGFIDTELLDRNGNITPIPTGLILYTIIEAGGKGFNNVFQYENIGTGYYRKITAEFLRASIEARNMSAGTLRRRIGCTIAVGEHAPQMYTSHWFSEQILVAGTSIARYWSPFMREFRILSDQPIRIDYVDSTGALLGATLYTPHTSVTDTGWMPIHDQRARGIIITNLGALNAVVTAYKRVN